MARDTGWEHVVAELVAERGDALLRYARLLSGSPDDAADLVQDALVRTFGRLRNGFTVASAEAYVRRAILNAYLDGGRRVSRWRKVAPSQYRPEEVPSPDAETDTRLDLHGELSKLTPRERACLLLRYYDDLKVDDIATTLGISAGAVKRYLSDGLAKMAIALADDGTVAGRLGPGGARPGTGTTPYLSGPANPPSPDHPTKEGDRAHRS
ncbi:RNA polymerase sigma factor [Protaetiibacter larvae]|uniref:SigE family RNA polymerase sigma factor n=1 Tax=Protaetiibacter larvae TaxID=2592654 RepID=A0A5C1YBZ3_9MICO|nr:SigE family RNA polymerase sigma factor [Protaetiibacter larvae]QEO10387.1 SigE family RNA polymerase sigma factor [Protaetiibacter larvae]